MKTTTTKVLLALALMGLIGAAAVVARPSLIGVADTGPCYDSCTVE